MLLPGQEATQSSTEVQHFHAVSKATAATLMIFASLGLPSNSLITGMTVTGRYDRYDQYPGGRLRKAVDMT